MNNKQAEEETEFNQIKINKKIKKMSGIIRLLSIQIINKIGIKTNNKETIKIKNKIIIKTEIIPIINKIITIKTEIILIINKPITIKIMIIGLKINSIIIKRISRIINKNRVSNSIQQK